MCHLQADGQRVETPRPYQGKRFEAWLSRLAEPQPDLSDADNLRNQELFVRVAHAIREVIADSQADAADAPWWLQKLVGCLHYSRSTVITFNYDTFFEQTLERCWLTDENFSRVRASDALRHMPLLAERPQQGLTAGYPAANTMRLIKLHGSIDTYWVNGDSSGATIRRWAQLSSNDNLKHLLPGRVPFIVPPASAKSSFYRNALTRQLWQDAAAAIATSAEVALIGYSLPPTDLVSAGMFGETLGGRNSRVVLVNPQPEQPYTTLRELGISESRITTENDCPNFVDALEQRFQPKLWHSDFSVAPAEVPVSIGVKDHPQLSVLGVKPGRTQDEVVIHVDHPGSSPVIGPDTPTVADITRSGENVSRLRVNFPNGTSAYVAETVVGLSNGGTPESLVLHPTAIPSNFFG